MTTRTSPFIAFLFTASVQAADLDFYRDVFPFLKTNCISCHNKTTTKAGLNMETPELMIKGGESGPSIVPGKGEQSLIVTASQHKQDMEMPPPNNKSGAVNLSPAQIAILKQWIDQGAKSSAQEDRPVVLKAFSASVDPIYSIAMTRDGRFAACGRSNDIFIYDLAAQQLAMQITDAHRALVQSLAFSPDGARLASGSFREVKIWRMETQKAPPQPVSVKPVDAAVIKKIADASKVAILNSSLAADGKTIIAGCADGSVRIWDAASLKPVAELRGTLAAKAKTAELEWMAAAQTLEQSFQQSEISRIEAQDKALDVLLGKAKEAIVAMQKALPEKQKEVKPAADARAEAQKAVNDLTAKLAAAKDAAIDRDLKNAQDKLITAKMTETSALAAVSAAESNVKDAEEEVKRISESKARNAKSLAAANATITAAKTAQGKAAAELAALKQAAAKAAAKPAAVWFSADARKAAALFDDGVQRVWAIATGQVIEESSPPASAGNPVPMTSESVPRWVLERSLSEKGLFADRVNAVRFSPDGKTLATGGGELSRSGDIVFFDAASGKPVRRWREKHSDTVLCLDFSPDGRLLASGGADKIARVTETATGKQLSIFEGHTHHVTGIAFRSDGRVLATAGADGVVSSWDMGVGERKKKIEGWTKEVTSLHFIGATNQIITSAGDNKVRIVTDDGAEIRSIPNLPDFMQASASSPNGGTLVAGGEDSVLRVWDGTNGKELAVFGTR